MDSSKNDESKKCRQKLQLRKLRLSLKYRPDILKLILKLKHCIKKKNTLLANLKFQLNATKKNTVDNKDSYTQTSTDFNHVINTDNSTKLISTKNKDFNQHKNDKKNNLNLSEEDKGWNVNKETENAVSIADQVKEVAQNALQQSGMVYVESAGMYYDYKTGYYYNSELGLYYHTDTSCYYYYSEEKQNFVFHSYPDRSLEAANQSLIAHEKKKAKKNKKEWKTEDDIDNLTKNLSQDKEDDGSAQATKPKRRKTIRKKEGSRETPIDDTKNKQEEHKKLENVKLEMEIIKTEKNENDLNTVTDCTVDMKTEELEDGECSGTDTEESEDEAMHDSTSTASDDESIAKHHPPCMRIIVKETMLPKLKAGSLFLVTKDGGSIGREGDHHCIVLKDQNVSRNHLNITYDLAKRTYIGMDLGSKNGTILNGFRMSESQTVSKSLEIVHGSTLEIGETKLLCHIHPGTDTCGHCEPGLLMETQEKEKQAAYTRTCSVQKQHQLELARLKNKYAPKPLAIEATAYNDRAQTRRDTVGSSHHSVKTQSSDLDTFIAPENKGFKLLEKMGWSKGEGLGKDNQGDIEPIPLVSNEGKAGLGNDAPGPAPVLNNKLGSATLRLASKTKMLKPPAKAFQQNDDEDETE